MILPEFQNAQGLNEHAPAGSMNQYPTLDEIMPLRRIMRPISSDPTVDDYTRSGSTPIVDDIQIFFILLRNGVSGSTMRLAYDPGAANQIILDLYEGAEKAMRELRDRYESQRESGTESSTSTSRARSNTNDLPVELL